MRQKDTDFWLLNIPDQIISDIERNLPHGCRVKSVDSVNSINIEQQDPLKASILFHMPGNGNSQDIKRNRELIENYNVQQVLVFDGDEKIHDTDINENGSFLGILHTPVSRQELESFKAKAVDIQDLYNDLHLMAREISLERELLARKNMQLEFLNRILSRSSSSLKVEDILAIAGQEFSGLIDARGLGAVFWKINAGKEIGAEIYLPIIRNKLRRIKWKDSMLEISKRFTGRNVTSYKEFELSDRKNVFSRLPEPLTQIVVPLYSNNVPFGALVVVADKELRLGRDQLQIINSAGSHLALAFRNALKFKDLKQTADYDGLTNIYNRQQFDKRIRSELKRHQRHAQNLSLIMLDLDYFKRLNDTYGHVAGDSVLKKIGNLLEETVRETDFAARYGGEEFVVILPETNEEQAWLLAERIRKRISETTFSHDDNRFNITASIGVASLKPGTLTPADMLVQQADQALYIAKNSGRNMVCTSADLCVGEAIVN